MLSWIMLLKVSVVSLYIPETLVMDVFIQIHSPLTTL